MVEGVKCFPFNISENFLMIKEPYFVETIPIYVNHMSFVFEPLNDFILRMHEFGIYNIYENNHTQFFRKVENETYQHLKETATKVLTMRMSEAGFVLWIAFIPIACLGLVFVGEHVVRYNSKRRRDARKRRRIKKSYKEVNS